MITVPTALKSEIQKLRGRRLQARCRIDYSDALLDNSIFAWSNGTQENSCIDQVYNGRQDVDAIWASLDGSWVLGVAALAPGTEADCDRYEIGWWSTALSMPSGAFQENAASLYGEVLFDERLYELGDSFPEVSVNFTARTVQKIEVSFDNARNEYGVDFDIVIFDIDAAELYREQVTGNAGLKYSKAIATFTGVASMSIFFYTWSHGGRQAKIAEMYTSISELYTGSDILSLQIIENRELPEDGAAYGSVASGQCTLSLVNKNRKFDYDNLTSVLYSLVREGVRITPEIGNGTDWIPLGVFYAKTWDISKRELSVTVTGMDRMEELGKTQYTTNTVISAPADETFDTDTDAEWNAGTRDGTQSVSNALRMAFS